MLQAGLREFTGWLWPWGHILSMCCVGGCLRKAHSVGTINIYTKFWDYLLKTLRYFNLDDQP